MTTQTRQTAVISTGDLMITSRTAIALVDQFGKDYQERLPHETQYDIQLSTIPEGVSLLITYVSGEDSIVQVIYEGIRYWVDTSMLTPLET